MTGDYFIFSFFLAAQSLVLCFAAFLHSYLFRDLNKLYIQKISKAFYCLSLTVLMVAMQHHYINVPSHSFLFSTFVFVEKFTFLLFWYYWLNGLCIRLEQQLKVHQYWKSTIGIIALLSVLLAYTFAWSAEDTVSRFYLRESLASFVSSLIALYVMFVLRNIHKEANAGSILMLLIGLYAFESLLYSFSSILSIGTQWHEALVGIRLVFEVAIFTLLAFASLLWVLESDRNNTLKAHEKAHYLDKHDSLTGILNRQQVIEKIPFLMTGANKAGVSLGFYLVDIKGFKFINDSYGMKAGDAVLAEIATRLKNSVLKPGIVGRLSGDSFIFAINVLNDEQEQKIAAHIHNMIERPFIEQGHEILLKCSVGFSLFPMHGEQAEDLMQKANLALHQAESMNIASVKYKMGMQSKGRQLVAFDKEIRRAFKARELVLYYQPQLNLKNNRLDGVEALIRWHHPVRGVLSPASFLEEIDALNLNSELDHYVLTLACEANKRWHEQYKRFVSIAVNISAVQFQDPKLVSKIQSMLFDYGIPPKYLELEITENAVITDMDSAMNTVIALQNLGIKVSIDDFGTGYSSLAYLRNLPIDKIKIDRSFVKDCTANDSDLTIVKSMIRLSHGLGKRVLAEGVETESQLSLLKTLDCDAIQGFYVNPPLSESDFVKYLAPKS